MYPSFVSSLQWSVSKVVTDQVISKGQLSPAHMTDSHVTTNRGRCTIHTMQDGALSTFQKKKVNDPNWKKRNFHYEVYFRIDRTEWFVKWEQEYIFIYIYIYKCWYKQDTRCYMHFITENHAATCCCCCCAWPLVLEGGGDRCVVVVSGGGCNCGPLCWQMGSWILHEVTGAVPRKEPAVSLPRALAPGGISSNPVATFIHATGGPLFWFVDGLVISKFAVMLVS